MTGPRIPADRWAAARAAYHRQRLNRIQDYRNINGPHLPNREAAQRLGVSVRTIGRYRAALREVTP